MVWLVLIVLLVVVWVVVGSACVWLYLLCLLFDDVFC